MIHVHVEVAKSIKSVAGGKRMIDKELLEILACPVDKSDLIYDEENQKLICKKCSRRYPIHDDIPIMLIEEAELPETNKKNE